MMLPSGTPQRSLVYFSRSTRALAVPLFAVQQPLQSESVHVSRTVTTIVLPVLDFRQRSCSLYASKLGKNDAMLCDITQLSDSCLLPHAESMPTNGQPLYMHSMLL